MHSEDDDFHDFDPYTALVEISELVAVLSASHNQLVDDYVETKKRLRSLEIQLAKIKNSLENKP